jgi:GNAT superfamily N-acetyltransferase
VQVTLLESEAQLASIPQEIDRDRPDGHVMVTEGGRLAARCSWWWGFRRGLKTQTPQRTAEPDACSESPAGGGSQAGVVGRGLQTPPPNPIGLIGHYAALDERAGLEALRRGCDRLAAAGCTTALGPMDGSTWQRYRFVTHRGSEPAFFLEPENADEWPSHFVGAGFSPTATYRSAVTHDLARAAAGVPDLEMRLRDRGITPRPLNGERLDRELASLYTISLEAFRENVAYSPITEEQFRLLYRSVLPFVRPELVTIAEFDRQAIGFLFAIPDALEASRSGSIRTVILKTMAVLPAWRGLGLGRLLFARTHAIALELGYTRAIHALMHDDNQSRTMSAQSARPFRRYALFARSL